jgi:hypothetical protein
VRVADAAAVGEEDVAALTERGRLWRRRPCGIKPRMDKLSCTDCGVLILPATAESNGGICMPCKQGTRQDIESARARYKAMSEYDPVRELWKSLVARASHDPALATFSPPERTYFTVNLLEGEVYNGGFDQFFFNSSGAYYQGAAAGLAELGASHSLGMLRQAAEAIFGKDDPPEDQAERWKVMQGEPHWGGSSAEQEMLLDGLDKQYCRDPDGLFDRLNGYAEVHGLIEPFKR